MNRYELKLNSAKKDLRNFMPERYIEACDYKQDASYSEEGFGFSDLGMGLSNAFRPFKICSNDVYKVFYETYERKHEYTSWSYVNFCINYIVNIFKYFKDMVIHPTHMFLSYVLYHLTTEFFVRLVAGKLNDEVYWDLPRIKNQSLFMGLVNIIAWAVFKIPVDVIGHILEIVFGVALVALSPATIFIAMLLDPYFSEATKAEPESVHIYNVDLDQLESINKYLMQYFSISEPLLFASEKGVSLVSNLRDILKRNNGDASLAEEDIVGTNYDEIKDIVETFKEQNIPKDVNEADEIELKLARFAASLKLSPVSLKEVPTLFPGSGCSSPVPSGSGSGRSSPARSDSGSDLERGSQPGDDLNSIISNENNSAHSLPGPSVSGSDSGSDSDSEHSSQPGDDLNSNSDLNERDPDQVGDEMLTSEQLEELLAKQRYSV